GAELVARQTDKCLTAEFAAALLQRTVIDAEAVFQREDCLQAAAEVFSAAQAPTAAVHRAAGLLPVAVTVLVVGVRDAGVDQAVQSDAALGVRRGGKNARQGCDHESLFHLVTPKARIGGECCFGKPSRGRCERRIREKSV